MSKETILLLTAVISTPFMGVLIASWFNKNKTSAETHNLNISGEINIGKAWQGYAAKMEGDFKELSLKFDELSRKFDVIKLEKDVLAIETKEKDARIKHLEERIVILEAEVRKYQKLS